MTTRARRARRRCWSCARRFVPSRRPRGFWTARAAVPGVARFDDSQAGGAKGTGGRVRLPAVNAARCLTALHRACARRAERRRRRRLRGVPRRCARRAAYLGVAPVAGARRGGGGSGRGVVRVRGTGGRGGGDRHGGALGGRVRAPAEQRGWFGDVPGVSGAARRRAVGGGQVGQAPSKRRGGGGHGAEDGVAPVRGFLRRRQARVGDFAGARGCREGGEGSVSGMENSASAEDDESVRLLSGAALEACPPPRANDDTDDTDDTDDHAHAHAPGFVVSAGMGTEVLAAEAESLVAAGLAGSTARLAPFVGERAEWSGTHFDVPRSIAAAAELDAWLRTSADARSPATCPAGALIARPRRPPGAGRRRALVCPARPSSARTSRRYARCSSGAPARLRARSPRRV